MAVGLRMGMLKGLVSRVICSTNVSNLNVVNYLNRFKDVGNKKLELAPRRNHCCISSCPGRAPFVAVKRNERHVQGQASQRQSHHPAFSPGPYPEIPSSEVARSFVLHLDDRGRSLLLHELNKVKDEGPVGDFVSTEKTDGPVSRALIWEVMMYHGIPFVGFGILDNMIMIIAGEYIDVTIGAALGITTMAAAALGNLVSDLAGVGTAGYVELLACKLGVKPPDISPAQALLWQIRWSVGLGRSIGITVGCLIGMFPLLFFDSKEDSDDQIKKDNSELPLQLDGKYTSS